jgi:hypothetical protein
MSDVAAYKNFRQQVASDLANRITAHQQAIATGIPAAQPAATTPLVMLADGDSWFDYPLYGVFLQSTDVIAQLPAFFQLPPYILNLAHYGDATTTTLGVSRYNMLASQLRDPKNGRFDAILFSGGGDDMVGDQFRLWLHDHSTTPDIGQALNSQAFADILGIVQNSYQDLIQLRNNCAPGIPIFTHCYDFAQPNGAGACGNLIGPWLYPSLRERGWMTDTSPAQVAIAAPIIVGALQQFNLMLTGLAKVPTNNLIVVPTQGTLATTEWANELHPNPGGFFKIAAKFAAALQTRFGSRAALVPAPPQPTLVTTATIDADSTGG